MATEEPVGFTADGKLITAWRLSDADKADMYMANEMYAASPEGKAQLQRFLDSLPEATVTIQGEWERA